MTEADYSPNLRRVVRNMTRGTSDQFSRAGGYHTELADRDYYEPSQQARLEAREYRQRQAFEADCHNRVLRALGSLTTNEAKVEFVEQVEALAVQLQEEPTNNG